MSESPRMSKNGRKGAPRLDVFDSRILEHIQLDNRMTAEVLAERVGLSPASVQKRLRHLRMAGFVESDIAILSPGLLGDRMTMILQVTLNGEAQECLDNFAERMRATPEVMQCYRVTGEAHFFVLLTVASLVEYEEFCERHIYRIGNVQRLITALVKERVKAGFFQPVGASRG